MNNDLLVFKVIHYLFYYPTTLKLNTCEPRGGPQKQAVNCHAGRNCTAGNTEQGAIDKVLRGIDGVQ